MKDGRKKRLMSLLLTVAMMIVMVSMALPMTVYAEGTAYYVDANGGNDSSNGTSEATPWKSLEKVNSTTFQPGDTICFRAGGIWLGTLYPKGSGVSGNPITIDRYGNGNNPIINGGGKAYSSSDLIDAAVYLKNQDYWTIRNLEVINDAAAVGERYGIHVDASDKNDHAGITIENCYIHNVAGDGNHGEHARIAAIAVWSRGWSEAFSNVKVINNRVSNTGSTGIYVHGEKWAGPATGIYIANNNLYDIGGDGILVCGAAGPLVEYNVVNTSHTRSQKACVAIWPFECDNAVFQFNEAYNTKTTVDGQGIDSDYMSRNTVFQYNYVHDNEGGFALICTDLLYQGNPAFNDGTVIRYNIAQNNAKTQFQLTNGITNTYIYNNVIYVRPGLSSNMISTWSADSATYPVNTHFWNNIFYFEGNGGTYDLGKSTGTEFDYNVFYGKHPATEPADPHKLTMDPLIGYPGQAGLGLESCSVYQLKTGSPCLNSGKLIPDNGGRDFWGNPVSSSAAPNRGPYNGPGLNEVPPPQPIPGAENLVKNPGFENGDLTPWTSWTSPGTAEVVNNNAHSGDYSIKISGNMAAAEQVVGNLHPGTAYRLTGWAKADTSQNIVIGIKEYGGVETSKYFSSANYTSGTINFTTGFNNTSVKIFLYKSSGTGSVYCDDIELVQVGLPPDVPPPETLPPAVEGSNDEFSEPVLNSQWAWLREDPLKWSLADNPGFMRIVCQKGDICEAGTDAKNILLTGAPEGDWTIETKMDGKPTTNWSQGGLIIWQDDDNFFRITRLYDNGGVIQFTKEINGIREYKNITDPVSSSTMFFKMVKNGDNYAAFYSPDGINYIQVWETKAGILSDIRIGLLSINGIGLTADFDYFHVTKGTVPIPPPPPPMTNVALHKPVAVDSVYANYVGENAVDGNKTPSNQNTRWLAANDTNPHWIEVDLGTACNIREIKFWTGSQAYNTPVANYQLQAWDGSGWYDIVARSGNTNASVDEVFEPVTTTKVRLYNNPGDPYVRLYEIEIYGWEADAVPPVTTLTADGNQNNGWYNTPVNINLTAADNQSGIEKTEYRLGDSGEFITYTEPFTITREGEAVIQYRSVDKADNIEELKQQTLRTDMTAPVSNVTVEGAMLSDGRYMDHATLTLTAVDNLAGSGINISEYSFDGTNWLPYTQPVTVTGAGISVFNFRSEDAAGNIEIPQNISITVVSAPDALIKGLIDKIKVMDIHHGIVNSLTSKLDNAMKAIAEGNKNEGVNILNAFIHEVNAQDGKKLTAVQAGELRNAADDIIAVLKEN